MDSFIEPFVQDALRHSPEELDEKEAKSTGGTTWLHSVAEFTRDRKGNQTGPLSIKLWYTK